MHSDCVPIEGDRDMEKHVGLNLENTIGNCDCISGGSRANHRSGWFGYLLKIPDGL